MIQLSLIPFRAQI